MERERERCVGECVRTCACVCASIHMTMNVTVLFRFADFKKEHTKNFCFLKFWCLLRWMTYFLQRWQQHRAIAPYRLILTRWRNLKISWTIIFFSQKWFNLVFSFGLRAVISIYVSGSQLKSSKWEQFMIRASLYFSFARHQVGKQNRYPSTTLIQH